MIGVARRIALLESAGFGAILRPTLRRRKPNHPQRCAMISRSPVRISAAGADCCAIRRPWRGILLAVYFPVPLSRTICGVPFALSVIVSVPLCFIAALGVNVTVIVHDKSAARLG